VARRKRRKPAASRTPTSAPPTDPRPRVLSELPIPTALAVASAVVFWLAFPPAGLWPLACIALVPLVVALRGAQRPTAIYLGAWAGGLVFFLLAVSWVRHADAKAWLGWFALAVYLSAYWPAFAWITRRTIQRLGLPATVVVPVVWTGLELVRDYLFTGFAWYFLGHTLYRVPVLIQIADLGGVCAVTFVLAAANALAADLWYLARGGDPQQRRRRLVRRGIPVAGYVALLVTGTLLYGHTRLRQPDQRWSVGPRVAVIQENIPQYVKHDEDRKEEIFEAHRRLTLEVAEKDKPRLIVWPETMCTYPWYEMKNEPPEERWSDKYREWREERLRIKARLPELHAAAQAVAGGSPVQLLIGIPRAEIDVRNERIQNKRNSALHLTEPGAAPIWYDKMHLVPFGEYLPLGDVFPFLVALTPYAEGYSIRGGTQPKRFEVDGHRFGVIICYESSVARVTRRFVEPDARGKGADFLLNISNDNWFKGSSELEMHLAQNVFRAVENRVMIYRAVNGGISACILPDGRILKRLTDPDGNDRLVRGYLTEPARIDKSVSLYTRVGDAWGFANVVGMLVFAVFSFVLRRGRRRA